MAGPLVESPNVAPSGDSRRAIGVLAVPAVALLVLGLVLTPWVPHPGFTLRGDRAVRVEPGAAADRAGLRPGDRVLTPSVRERILCLRAGETAEVEVEREDGPAVLTVRAEAPHAAEQVRRAIQSGVGLTFVLLGLVVATRRRDRTADLFALFSLAMGALLHAPIPLAEGWPARLLTLLEDVAQVALGPLLVHFFFRFPAVSSHLRGWMTRLLYAPGAALVAAAGLDALGLLDERLHEGILAFAGVYLGLCLVVAATRFVQVYLTSRRSADRRRLRAMVAGTLVALVPIILGLALSATRIEATLRLESWSALFLLGLPIGYAYAIVRYQALDLRVIVRRGLVAAAAAIGVGVLLAAVLVAVDRAVGLSRHSPWTLAGAAAALTLLVVAAGYRIRHALDRILAPELEDRLRRVRAYEERLGTLLSERRVLGTLLENIVHLFDAEHAAFYRLGPGDDRLVLVEERGAGHGRRGAVYLGEALRVPLRALRRVVDPDEVLALAAPGERAAVAERLDALGFELFAPIREGEELRGLLALAAPRSRGAYTRSERRALARLAVRGARALETARAHEDAVARERMARDLEVARGIQVRLLPKSAPLRLRAEFRAVTQSCEAVGGDFHDFFDFPDGRVGLAVGDVCGKGIGASLLMAAVHSALHAEAMSGASPAGVLRRMNLRLLERNEPDKFVCLFYAVLDPDSGRMTYANAGVEPPILVRGGDGWSPLTEGGLVLGVSAEAAYPEVTMDLAAGDRLLVFTDGAVESAPGPDADPGRVERRIRDLVQAVRTGAASPRSALRRALRVAGMNEEAEARDDATLLLVRMW